jgi:ABC-type multidrug transport system permease subunit
MLHLLRSYLHRLAKTPSVPLLWLAFPIVISLIEYAAFGSIGGPTGLPRGTLLLVDHDRSLVSGLLRSALQREPLSDFFSIATEDDTTRIRRWFETDDATAALVVPAGLQDSIIQGGQALLTYTPNPRQSIRPQMIEASLETFFEVSSRLVHEAEAPLKLIRSMPEDALNRESFLTVSAAFYDVGQDLRRLTELPNLEVEVERPAPKEPHPSRRGGSLNFFTYFMPGLLLFSLLMVGEGFEKRFFDDRRRGLARRIHVAPIPRHRVLLAESMALFLGILVCAVVVLGLGVTLLEIRPRQPAVLAAVLFGFTLVVIGLVKSLFARARSERAASTLASVVILLSTLVGGGFAPVEVFAEGVQPLARLTPVGAASQAMIDALVHGKSLAETGRNVAVTWAWGVGLCGLAFALSRRAHVRG